MPDLPGALAYGTSQAEAVARVKALALRVLAALWRMGWTIKRHKTGSHYVLSQPNKSDYVFAFHDDEEIGPRMLACTSKRTGLQPEDL